MSLCDWATCWIIIPAMSLAVAALSGAMNTFSVEVYVQISLTHHDVSIDVGPTVFAAMLVVITWLVSALWHWLRAKLGSQSSASHAMAHAADDDASDDASDDDAIPHRDPVPAPAYPPKVWVTPSGTCYHLSGHCRAIGAHYTSKKLCEHCRKCRHTRDGF